MKLTASVEFIIDKLNASGYEAYAVGGCVRDSLLGIVPKDWDICTSAMPHEIMNVFDGQKIIPTGLQHGTVTLMLDNMPFELTTYRIDGLYSDNRHPDRVNFVNSLHDDLKRRDFTINAMAFNYQTGLVDLFGGKSDLANKILRCVGDPDTRFKEDALRIFRALRFSSVYDFTIDNDTAVAMNNNKELLCNISPERLYNELKKFIIGDNVERLLIDFRSILAQIIPQLQPMFDFKQYNPYHCYDVWTHTVKSVAAAPKDDIIRLTMLFHDIGKPSTFFRDEKGVGHFYGHSGVSKNIAQQILSNLRVDNHTGKVVLLLVEIHDIPIEATTKAVGKRLAKIGEENFRRLLIVKKCDAMGQDKEVRKSKLQYLQRIEDTLNVVLTENHCFSIKDLHINGNDIISLGAAQGERIGRVLQRLFEMVIDEQISNNHTVLIREAKKLLRTNFLPENNI